MLGSLSGTAPVPLCWARTAAWPQTGQRPLYSLQTLAGRSLLVVAAAAAAAVKSSSWPGPELLSSVRRCVQPVSSMPCCHFWSCAAAAAGRSRRDYHRSGAAGVWWSFYSCCRLVGDSRVGVDAAVTRERGHPERTSGEAGCSRSAVPRADWAGSAAVAAAAVHRSAGLDQGKSGRSQALFRRPACSSCSSGSIDRTRLMTRT